LAIFPNPTSGIVNITGLTQPAEVKIYSLQGQLLKSLRQVQSGINVSDLSSGVYIIHLTSGGDITVRKLVVKK
jgi:hypothetical protein